MPASRETILIKKHNKLPSKHDSREQQPWLKKTISYSKLDLRAILENKQYASERDFSMRWFWGLIKPF
jgi:hypothetical protein